MYDSFKIFQQSLKNLKCQKIRFNDDVNEDCDIIWMWSEC